MLDSLGSIKVPKSCEVLAEKLQAQILSGDYPAGVSLPTERELVEATGLSRGSIRETLRILEAQGLVRTRPGRYGGSVVAQPTNALLASHINLFARVRSVPLRALVETRQALEPMVAYLAAATGQRRIWRNYGASRRCWMRPRPMTSLPFSKKMPTGTPRFQRRRITSCCAR